MRLILPLITVLFFSFNSNAQTVDDRVLFTCEDVENVSGDSIPNYVVVLEQTEGNALDFMKPLMNATDVGFVLKYFSRKSDHKSLDDILNSEPAIYSGFADNMGSNSLFFEGRSMDASGNLGTTQKTFLIEFAHDNRGEYSTPGEPGFDLYKCKTPKYSKIKDSGDSQIDGQTEAPIDSLG